MLTEFLNRLLELKQDPVITTNDGIERWSSTMKPVFPLRQVHLDFATLTGLVDYLRSPMDKGYYEVARSPGPDPEILSERPMLALHVVSSVRVDLITENDLRFRDRITVARSSMTLPMPKFRDWLDQEDFSVFVQTEFVATPERAELLAMVGVMDAEDVRTSKDDGVTQTVSARKGIVLRERKPVPNPIILAPYRTFREVPQPASLFVPRVREAGSGIQLALFPADGDAWSLEAMQNIKTWLKDNIEEDSIPILA